MTSPSIPESIDLTSPMVVHIIGVGGAGMSSIATILAEMGHTVSGSDVKDSPGLQRLRDKGVRVLVGHRAEQIGSSQLVLRSTAIGADNPEYLEARSKGVPVLNRTAFLPLLAARTPFVSISGTHGKTTTSSMTAVALTGVGADPSFLVGSYVHALGASAGHRSGSVMVLEADESDGSFLAGPRAAALVTNVEPDHLDYWGSWDALVAGFGEFLDSTDGPCVVCVDDPTLAAMSVDKGTLGYGFAEFADYRIVELHMSGERSRVDVVTPAGPVTLSLAVPGRYNAANATGALALVHALGYGIEEVAASLGSYSGVSRRFEHRGRYAGIEFVDDYAHHPTELESVLGAAMSGGWQRVVATFQPHRYSRTESLWDEFASCFDGVDVLVVTDIYSAGEQPRPGIEGARLAEAIGGLSRVGRVEFRPRLEDAASFLASELRSGDLALSLGAGDVTTLTDLVLEELHRREVTAPDGCDG